MQPRNIDLAVDWAMVPDGFVLDRIAVPKSGEYVAAVDSGKVCVKTASCGANTVCLIIKPAPWPNKRTWTFDGTTYKLASDVPALGFAVPTTDNCDAFLNADLNNIIKSKNTSDKEYDGGRRWLLREAKPRFVYKLDNSSIMPHWVYDSERKLDVAAFRYYEEAVNCVVNMNKRDQEATSGK